MAYLLIAAILWGSSFPVIRYALGDVSPLLFVALRFSLAFVILLPRYRRFGDVRTLFRRDLFLISIPNALSFILQFKAQELTTASKTALFVNSAPIFVVVFGWLFYRSRFRRRQLVALALALCGVVVTSTRLDFAEFASVNLGDAMGLCVGALWGAFILFSADVVKRYSPSQVAQALYFWTVIITLPLLATEDLHFSLRAAGPVVYMATFTTVLAYFLYLKGVRVVSPLSTSIVILIEIVVAFVISHFLLSESFSAVEAAGVVMVLGGVLMVLKR